MFVDTVRLVVRVRWILLSTTWLFACRGGTTTDSFNDAQASPQASAIPAPLATEPQAMLTTAVEAGPPPSTSTWRGDEPIDRDSLPSAIKDPLLKDASPSIYSLVAALRPLDPPPIPKVPEVNTPIVEAARKRLDPRWIIDFSPSRIRMTFDGPGWLLPSGWQLRARVDRYGYLLVNPSESTYLVLPPGALRALIGERRLDVSPIAAAELSSKGEGAKRLGFRTRRVEVSSRSAKATFEMARIDGSGEAGAIMARALLDLMSAPPSTLLALPDEVPMHAELRWTTRGGLVFEAISISKRPELALTALSVPPPSATFATGPLPSQAALVFFPEDLPVIHTAAVDSHVPVSPDPHGRLSLANATDELRVAWIDGSEVAWLAPRARIDLDGLLRGHYQVEWRTYLGDAADTPAIVAVPGTSEVGSADRDL